MQITTNNVPRPVLDAHELPLADRAEFDYLDWNAIEAGSDSASFIRYHGMFFDLGEFEVWDNPASPTRQGWDAVRPDSFFSGLVIRFTGEECDEVIVGRYIA